MAGEIKTAIGGLFLFLFSLKILCCHDNTCFCLNLTLFEILSLPMHFSHGNIFLQFSSVAQSCLTLCNPMNRSTPGLPVHHQFPEFTQTQTMLMCFKKKNTYLLGNLPFFKILVNCFMARHGSACANAVSK